MITPTKAAPRIEKKFVVCDIENRSDGSVIAIDTYDGEFHHFHFDWESWLCHIRKLAKTNPNYRTIYAHNGGGWDWLSLIEWIVSRSPETIFHTIENGGRIVCCIVPPLEGENHTRRGVSLRLVDSLFLLQSSLDKAMRTFLGRGKVETDGRLPEALWEQDRAKFWDYLRGDTEGLYATLAAFADLVYGKIAKIPRLGLTLPATALRCFAGGYLKSEIGTPDLPELKSMLREGYVGGRVEVFRPGYYRDIHVYDFNSLYPAVMASTAVPTSGLATRTNRYVIGDCGVYRIRYRQRNRRLLPLCLRGGVGSYEGEGVYYSPELFRLLSLADGEIEVLDGWKFRQTDVIFRDYVHTLYALRMSDKDGAIGAVCKLLMNSLYGKFGQKPVRYRTLRCGIADVRKYIGEGATVETLSEELGIFRISEHKETPFEHCGIAGIITSEARGRLWEAFNTGTVYCDTDSVHTTDPIEGTGLDLGMLKHEFSGEGVYVGKKLYALRNQEIDKVKAKGIRVKGNLGFSLEFADLLSLLDGSKIECTFHSASTAKHVMGGGKACVFAPRKRTIRQTANVTNA